MACAIRCMDMFNMDVHKTVVFVQVLFILKVISVVHANVELSTFQIHADYYDIYCSGEAVVYGKVSTDVICAHLCYQMTGCTGFFYNTVTQICSPVKIVYVPENGCQSQEGSVYYTMQVPGMFDCYNYTDSDRSRLVSETDRSVCNSYKYHTYNQDLTTSVYGCGDCQCCKTKGCYTGVLQLYNGTWSTSVSGRKCQRWDQQYPHSHLLYLPEYTYPPGETLSQANNYCRDPDNEGFLWCYTVDPDLRFETCGIPMCA